jgi:hypothetical protein
LKKQQSYRLWTLLGLGLYLFLALSNHVSIAEGQLGYFMREGAMFWQQGEILFSNSLTYTSPEHPMYNNHWLSNAFFYAIKQGIGFGGLHFLIAALYVLAFSFLFRMLVQSSNLFITILVGLLAAPLFATHYIIAPVFFTHLFSIVFFVLLYQYLNDKKTIKWLYILPVLQLLWVNCHAYFFISWGLLLTAFLHALFHQKAKATPLLIITIICLAASFIHPQFARGSFGALSTAFSSSEILPIWERTTLDAYLFTHSYSLLYVLILSIITLLGSFALGLKIKTATPKFFIISTSFLLIFFSFWNNQLVLLSGVAWIIIAFPIFNYYLDQSSKEEDERHFLLQYNPPVLALYLLLPIFCVAGFIQPINNFGYGLRANETESVDFINHVGIQGPFFHNSAISGLMAYGLPQEQPLYLSTQALAHPVSFLTQKYFPQILDPYTWKAIHDEYQFNAIVFRLKNESTSQLEFMGNLLSNGKWAMVYYKKDYEVILLKRNQKNQALINQYEIIPNTE